MSEKKNKGGRPRIQFDLDVIEGLGRIGATVTEMAGVLGCSRDVIADRINPECPRYDEAFAQALEKGRSEGKTSLRREQMRLALKGNATMLIWLGKQLLGQRDRQDLDAKVEGPGIVRIFMPSNGREVGATDKSATKGPDTSSGSAE